MLVKMLVMYAVLLVAIISLSVIGKVDEKSAGAAPIIVDLKDATDLKSKYSVAQNADAFSTFAQEIFLNKEDPCEQRIRQTLVLNAKAAVESYNAAYWKLRSEKLDKTQANWIYNRDKGQFEPPPSK